MADAGKEEMRVAFAQKIAQLKLELDFTQLYTPEKKVKLFANYLQIVWRARIVCKQFEVRSNYLIKRW